MKINKLLKLSWVFFLMSNTVLGEEIELNEITISANLTPTQLSEVGSSVNVVTEDEIAMAENSYLVDFIERLPGVRVSQSGPKGALSAVSVRGLDLKYIKVLVDGLDVSDVSSVPVMANMSGLMLPDIERIEILKGSQSALYGSSAIGGVISITTKKQYDSDGFLSAEVGSYGTSELTVGRSLSTDKLDVWATGTIFETEGFSAKAGGAEADGYSNDKVSVKGNYYNSENSFIKFHVFYQKESGEQDGYGEENPFEFIDKEDEIFRSTSLGLSSGLEINSEEVNRDLAFNLYQVDRFYTGPYNYEGDKLAISYKEERNLGDGTLLIGLEQQKAETVIEDVAKDIDLSEVFSEYIFDSEKINVTASGRYSTHSNYGGNITGRLSASYITPTSIKFRGSIGTGYRAPSLYELYAPIYGNSELMPETSLSYDLGVETSINGVDLSGTVFDTEIKDRIVWDFETEAYGQSTVGESRTGYELMLDYEFVKNSSISIAYTHTEDGNGNRVQKVPENQITFAGKTEFNSGIKAAGSINRIVGLEDFGALPDYTLVSGRISYPFTQWAEVYVRVENILDEKYQTTNDYGTAGRSFYTGITKKF